MDGWGYGVVVGRMGERLLGGGEDGRQRERERQGLSLSYNSWV